MRGDISHALLDSQLLLVVAGISGSYIYRTFFSTRGLGTGKHILLNQQCSRQSGLATGWQYVTAHYCPLWTFALRQCRWPWLLAVVHCFPWPWLSYSIPAPEVALSYCG